MRVGSVDVEPGATARGTLEICECEVPILVARGREDGPTLWISAAIHGDELEGTAALWEVFETLAGRELRGTVIESVVTNVSAFQALRRTSPIDDLDVNRVFPGSPDRSFTLQFADAYKRAVEAVATHYVDLHGGGNTHDVVFYTIYRDGLGDASRVSREMALAAGSPIVWASRDEWLDHGLFTLLTARGIPSLIVEAGGEGRIRRKNVRAHASAVLNVLTYLAMIDGDAPAAEVESPVSAADFFFSHRGGIWLSDREPGEQLDSGELVGVIRDPHGSVLEEVRVESGRSIVLALRTYATAPLGASLGILGVLGGVDGR
jgi:predicted deacylase